MKTGPIQEKEVQKILKAVKGRHCTEQWQKNFKETEKNKQNIPDLH